MLLYRCPSKRCRYRFSIINRQSSNSSEMTDQQQQVRRTRSGGFLSAWTSRKNSHIPSNTKSEHTSNSMRTHASGNAPEMNENNSTPSTSYSCSPADPPVAISTATTSCASNYALKQATTDGSGDDAAPIISSSPGSSPGTPKAKVWEQRYRSFLLRGTSGGNVAAGGGETGNADVAEAPALPTIGRSRAQQAEQQEEGSVRGGNFFANMFPPSRRRSKSSNSYDELDGTLRNGSEKSLCRSYDPLDGTLRKGHEKSYSPSTQRNMFGQCTSTTGQQYPIGLYIPPRVVASEGNLTGAATAVTPESLTPVNSMRSPVGVIASATTSGVNSSVMKKKFTEFHNARDTGHDAEAPFLGDSPSLGHNRHVLSSKDLVATTAANQGFHWEKNQLLQAAAVQAATLPPMDNGNSRSYESRNRKHTSDCSSSRNQQKCTLKPIQGVSTWQPSRRYLIAPAVMAECPFSVVTTALSAGLQPANSHLLHSATKPGVSEDVVGSGWSPFEMMQLGPCLLRNMNQYKHEQSGNEESTAKDGKGSDKDHQEWSRAILMLRQNYLLEYEHTSSDTAEKEEDLNSRSVRSLLPRGYAHLQHATCHLHPDFSDALELHFYASPCAKADRRVILIRLPGKENKLTYWMECLKRAASLTVDDLYHVDQDENPLGKGQYASVYTARRRSFTEIRTESEISEQKRDNHDGCNSDDYNTPRNDACALKIFNKTKFWQLVLKGRERADTMVRETSVQAALTADCAHKVNSFVRLTGFFETSDQVVLEMELLHGTADLFKYISTKGFLSEFEAARILRDILRALEALNFIGLAHRDIKPANVLMCPNSTLADSCTVKVCDFGMSTFVGVDGQVRGRCGTPGYVAPEIFTAGTLGGYGNKVDVFSAGVTLYVMLCGYEPFYGETNTQLIHANKEAHVDFPLEDWSNVSHEARDLLLKMMAANPNQRLDAKQSLQHPWFQQLLEDDNCEQATSLEKTSTCPENMVDNACAIS